MLGAYGGPQRGGRFRGRGPGHPGALPGGHAPSPGAAGGAGLGGGGVFRRYLEVERVSLLTGEDEGGRRWLRVAAVLKPNGS
jgi:hypothetical protein